MTSFDWHEAFARAEARGLLRNASGPAGADDIAAIEGTTGLSVTFEKGRVIDWVVTPVKRTELLENGLEAQSRLKWEPEGPSP